MSRWHLTTCRAPNIEVRGRAPFCRACGTEPDLPQLIAAKRNDSPFPPCPPDELPGAFNFSWPTTVPFTHQSNASRAPNRQAPNQRPDPTPTSFQPALPSSPVYPIRLGSDELRVIILSASDDPTYPLHVDLESHHDGRCPEYETVSYSWGGENGDSSSSHPLFVGPYWDVLLLTKNCFDMLGYLRPWRGARTVWVDSICINQDDVQERETQVAKMARIYSECRQVIVYLGEDIVAPTMPGQYPFRRRLEDSIGDPQIGFLNLLSRRYFSRVWIIQELILPRQVVIPVGDMEISVDKTSGGALSWYNWNASAAPWFIEIGRRYLPQGNICDILRLICYSTSTDPRDKVFGAHALINNTQQDQLALRPDYSLSCLHVFFGVFAHSLITLKRTELLCNAAGISARDGYPSWTPDWTSPGAVENWFQQRPPQWGANRENTFGLSGGERGTWATHGNLPEQQGTTEKDLTAHAKSFMHVSPGALRWRTSFDLRWDEDIASMLWTDEVPLDVFSKGVDGIQAQARKSRQWDHEVSIDSATGSLSLQLIYLLAFPTPLERVAEEAGQSTFCLTTRTQWGDAEMYLTTDDGLPLDHIIQPELDHLFLMDRGHTEALLYLVLRSCQNERNEWGYRLLGCCYHLYFHAHPGTWHRRSLERIWGSKWDPGLKDEVVIEKELLRPDSRLFLADLQPSLHDLVRSVWSGLRDIEAVTYDRTALRVLFVRNQEAEVPVRHIIGAVQGLLNEKRGTEPGFLESYAACLSPRYKPEVHGEYVELCFPAEQWEYVHGDLVRDLYKEWRNSRSSEWSKWGLARFSLFRSSRRPVYMRARKQDLERMALELGLHTKLSRLTRAALRERTSEADMVRFYQQGWDEGRAGGMGRKTLQSTHPVWPESIVKGFNIDGFTYRVTIF